MPLILEQKAKRNLWHDHVQSTKKAIREKLKQSAREASQAQKAPLVPQKAKQSATFKMQVNEEQAIPSVNSITYSPPPIRQLAPIHPVITGNANRPRLKD